MPRDREKIREIINRHEGVDEVVQLLTMAIGPEALLVAARIHLKEDLDAGRIEQLAQDIEAELSRELPHVREVFLDPTSRREALSRRLDTTRP